MLRDSLSDPEAGHHVEQLEIVFSQSLIAVEVGIAWEKTIELCEVLRTCFSIFHGIPAGQQFVSDVPEMMYHAAEPACRELWFEADRREPLVLSGRVPWRTAFWPEQHRFVWTFHHAMLDGRSITKVVRVFLELLAGGSPEVLALARWELPTAEAVALAGSYFSRIPACLRQPVEADNRDSDGSARRTLGFEFLAKLERIAAVREVTAATILIWAWGQALAETSGEESVIVEQMRAGSPQRGHAGFTMNVLPLHIRRGPVSDLTGFRGELLELRGFETISPADFPFGTHPDTSEAPTIMIESATMRHALGNPGLLESIDLRERSAGFPSAIGYLHPDLQLRVEGPAHQRLLDRWCEVLERPELGIGGGIPLDCGHF